MSFIMQLNERLLDIGLLSVWQVVFWSAFWLQRCYITLVIYTCNSLLHNHERLLQYSYPRSTFLVPNSFYVHSLLRSIMVVLCCLCWVQPLKWASFRSTPQVVISMCDDHSALGNSCWERNTPLEINCFYWTCVPIDGMLCCGRSDKKASAWPGLVLSLGLWESFLDFHYLWEAKLCLLIPSYHSCIMLHWRLSCLEGVDLALLWSQ